MSKAYFTGHYFRVTQSEEDYSIAVIVGLRITPHTKQGFIQVTDTSTEDSYYITFPHNEFQFHTDPFYIQCGKNIFTKEFMYLSLDEPGLVLHGLLTFNHIKDIHRTHYAPTIMGPFSYLPLPCYHHILSLEHEVNGVLTFNEQCHHFSQASGYIEGDYGHSFPTTYTWLQCNTFKKQDIQFTCAFAKLPILKTSFRGVIAILTINGKEHRFATYNGAFVESYSIHKQRVFMIIRKGDYRLIIHARQNNPKSLFAPSNGHLRRVIKEDLGGSIFIEFYKKNRLLAKAADDLCAIEIVPPLIPKL